MSRPIVDLVRPNIISLQPFSSARAEYSGSADVYLDANENPFPSAYNRYPDPHHTDLKIEIANWKKCECNQIILGNGSDEIIDFIVRAFCVPGQDIVRTISPTFGMYKVVAGINDVVYEEVLLDENYDVDVKLTCDAQSEHHKILFLCSPNNPTGNNLSEDRVVACIKKWKGLVVIDEAYIDFSGRSSFVSEINKYSNLIILQTFSKALGAAGLRIGMCFSNHEIISYLEKIKPPYNIGKQSQKEAIGLLRRREELADQVAEIITEREKVEEALGDIRELNLVVSSDSNFLLYQCERHRALKGHLESKGIIVRDRSNLPKCENCLRLTIGTRSENDRLIDSIQGFYK